VLLIQVALDVFGRAGALLSNDTSTMKWAIPRSPHFLNIQHSFAVIGRFELWPPETVVAQWCSFGGQSPDLAELLTNFQLRMHVVEVLKSRARAHQKFLSRGVVVP
jgi:hypothetical protein